MGELDIIKDEDLKAPLDLAANYKKLANDFDAVVASTTQLVNKLETQEATMADLTESSKKLEKEQKKLEAANKKAAKSAESMAAATELADNATGGLISRTKALGKQFITLIANPIVALFAALAVVVGSVATYFKSTNEGADKLENIMGALSGIVSYLRDKFAALGEQIVKLFEDGNVVGELLIGVFGRLFNMVAGVIDVFTNLLKIVNILSQYNMRDLFLGNIKPEDITELRKAFVDLGKSAIQSFTGIGNAAEEAAKKSVAAVALIERARELEDAIRARIISKAESELAIEKLLFDAKDKSNKTDQQRLDALKQALTLSEQQLKVDLDLAVQKERQFTAELLERRNIIGSVEEVNKVLRTGTTIAQDQLLQEKAFGEELDERAKLQADIINLQRNYYAETKKSVSQIAALEKEITDEMIRQAEVSVKARIKGLDDYLAATKFVAGQEQIGFKSMIEQNAELHKNFGQRIIDDAKARLEKEKELEKLRTEQLKEQEEKRKLIRATALQAVGMIGDEIFARRQENLAQEAKTIEENRARDLAAAGDDERKKLAINRKADREMARIKTKQAQADKQAAIFGIIINTALGIVKAAPVVPLMVATGIIGAIQLALVASKPIPKFATGSDHTPSTFIAGEKGRELVQHRGKLSVADGATLFTGMEGARVFSNLHTEEILGDVSDIGPAINYGTRVRRQYGQDIVIAESLRENNKWLRKIASKPDVDFVVDEEGFHTYSKKIARRNERIVRRFGR